MKVLKIAFPILLALVILLCVLFPVLALLQNLSSSWLFNQMMIYGNTFESFNSYSILINRANANVLGTGSLPILSLLPIGGFLNLIYSLITDSLVPFAITVVCALILVLYFVLMKTKTSLNVSGSLAKVLKIVTVVLLGGGILASLSILVLSLIMAIYSVFSFIAAIFDFNSYGYWSYLITNLMVATTSLVTVLVFFFITVALAILIILTLKSKSNSTVASKKALIVSTLISGVGIVISLLIGLHYTYTILASVVFSIIYKYSIGVRINYLTSALLVLLIACVFGGFLVNLIKSILAIKQSKAISLENGETENEPEEEAVEITEEVIEVTEENDTPIVEQAI